MKRLVLYALLASPLAACTATGPAFTQAAAPPEGSVLVYIYRLNAVAFSARKAKFYVDSVHVADLNAEGYTWIHVPSGIHEFTQRWPKDVMAETIGGKVRFVPGRTYYFRLTSGSTSTSLIWQLTPESAEDALPEIKACRFQKPAVDAG